MTMKLQQGQLWKNGDEFIRIVHLERLEVGYKVAKNLKSGEGTHLRASKKEFCRLLKSATLLTSGPRAGSSPPASPEEAIHGRPKLGVPEPGK
jgi:hypothetical protein